MSKGPRPVYQVVAIGVAELPELERVRGLARVWDILQKIAGTPLPVELPNVKDAPRVREP